MRWVRMELSGAAGGELGERESGSGLCPPGPWPHVPFQVKGAWGQVRLRSDTSGGDPKSPLHRGTPGPRAVSFTVEEMTHHAALHLY